MVKRDLESDNGVTPQMCAIRKIQEVSMHWVQFDDASQQYAENIIAQAKLELLDVNQAVKSAKFPYGFHHEYCRKRIMLNSQNPTNSQIALLLNNWAVASGDTKNYVRQAIAGAMAQLSKANSGLVVPPAILLEIHEMNAPVPFLEWANANIHALKSAL